MSLVVGVLGSWAGQVPAVALLLDCWQQSLSAVYIGVALGYALVCLLLAASLLRLDWAQVSREAQQRAVRLHDRGARPERDRCLSWRAGGGGARDGVNAAQKLL